MHCNQDLGGYLPSVDREAGILVLEEGHDMDQPFPYPSHFSDEVLAEEPLVHQKILGDDPVLDCPSDHLNGGLGLFLEELILPFSGAVSSFPRLVEAAGQLLPAQTEVLFAARLGVKREIQWNGTLPVGDGQHQQLVAQYALLCHMVKHPADAFHADAGLLQSSVIQNEVALLLRIGRFLPDNAEEGLRRGEEQTAPVHARTCQEAVELVLSSFYKLSELLMKRLVDALSA